MSARLRTMARKRRRSFKLRGPFVITDKRTLAFLLTALRFTETRYHQPRDEDMILEDPWESNGDDCTGPLEVASFDDIADLLNDPDATTDRGFWYVGRRAARPSRPYGRPWG